MASSAGAAKIPKFADFPVQIYRGTTKPPKIDDALMTADQIRSATTGKPNFAGRYEFIEVSAGTGCRSAAVVNLSTGTVEELPFAACFWKDTDRPFYYRADSRLLVLSGRIGEEEEEGAHFFEFKNGRFQFLMSRSRDGRVLQTGHDDSPPHAEDESQPTPDARGPTDFDFEAGTKKIMSCYSDGIDRELANIAVSAREFYKTKPITYTNAYKAKFLAAGGYLRIGTLVRNDCDNGFLTENPSVDGVAVVRVMGKFFDQVVFAMDKDFAGKCASRVDDDELKSAILISCSALK